MTDTSRQPPPGHDAAPKPPADWAAAPERANLAAVRVMRRIAIAAGRDATRLLLPPIALYFLLAAPSVRRASQQYLRRALGRPAGWRDGYRHLHHFAATVLDRVYFLQERFEQFDVASTGHAPVVGRLERGEGAFMVGAHMGSFEALRALGEEHGRRVAMVMYEDNARVINAALAAIAPAAKLRTIALGRLGAMLELRRWLEGGGIAGLLADRTLPGAGQRAKTVWLPFLGAPAAFSDGPFRLAALLRRPIVFMVGLYHGGPRYELRFVELADFAGLERTGGTAAMEAAIDAALRRYVTLLEAACREAPFNWFNFYDFWAADASAAANDPPPPPPRDRPAPPAAG